MVRPIETNMSLYTVEQRASEAKDPNAHQFQVQQQHEMEKQLQRQAQSVQPLDKTEGEVKVREKKDEERDQRGGKKKKKSNRDTFGDGYDEGEEAATASPKPSNSTGGFNFLA